jgi:hypothetical protein
VLGDTPILSVSAAQRRECERVTGLKWVQIYKWNFDRQLNKKRVNKLFKN